MTTKDGKTTSLVPKLRFPEFREADGWTNTCLSDVADIKTGPFGSTLHQSDYAEVGTPIVTVEHLSDHGLVHENLPLVSDEDKRRLSSYVLREGDIVFSRVGSVDRNSLVSNREEGWLFSGRLLRIRANENGISPAFLSFYFQLEQTKRKIRSVAVGQTMPSLNTEILNAFPVVAASPAEQRKIAECLTSLDALIAARGRKLAALAAHKKGLMQQLFPRPGEPLPRLRFPEFRKSPWVKKAIGDILQETSRPIAMDDDTEYELVTVKRRFGGVVARETLKGSAIKVKSQFLVEEYDFLISKRQIVHNACGLVPADLHGSIVSNEYSVLTPREDNSVQFFNYFAQQPVVSKSFFDSSVGIVIEKMLFKLDWWLKYEFLFPKPAEQQRIAACLGSLDAALAAEAQALSALRTHKKGLMQQLFPSTEAGAGATIPR